MCFLSSEMGFCFHNLLESKEFWESLMAILQFLTYKEIPIAKLLLGMCIQLSVVSGCLDKNVEILQIC